MHVREKDSRSRPGNPGIEVIKEVAYINTCIFLKNDLKLNITSTYRSHSISKVDFIQTFKEILNKYKKAKNHYIVGDFNIDFLKNDKIAEDELLN